MEVNRLGGLERRATEVAALRRRVERWRARRERGARMPTDLWQAAVELARAHGVSRIARALGLSYRDLKGRLGERPPVTGEVAAGEFVELNAALLPAVGASVIEVSDASGRKLVIRLGSPPDVPAVLGAFWR